MTDGVLILDKPAGVTSHDVVDMVRRALGTRKVGHLGTLDPAATGVLPLVVGRATRLARYLHISPKEYTGEICLGWETTTGDREGTKLGQRPVAVGSDQILEAMASLTGSILQAPPAYSARKVAGVRAYRLARAGGNPEPEPARVEVHLFELERFDSPLIRFRVVCSGGTYIRSLARDLGRQLETGGHLASLRRTRCGAFGIEDARRPDRVSEEDLIDPAGALRHLGSLVVDDEAAEHVRHGRRVPCPTDASPLCIFNKKSELIAIGHGEKGWAHPEVVLL
jgi:tRNA pseudouridine55 synthase